ncbi:MAG: hypothetical protein JWO58_613 [Chitinophagaceae bacterium]|nr:hypothetical protein [Chitinophagaceae bacterium]
MKTSYYLLAILFISITFSHAQDEPSFAGAVGDDNWTKNWTSYLPNGNNYPPHNLILPRIIDKDLLLTNKNTYLLSGAVYVMNNAVLTIEAGTIIRGESETCGTLVITKGSKLIAVGTERDPIIFTSNKSVGERKAGDWGGIILLGNAVNNHIGGVSAIDWGLDTKYTLYGGDNDNENSGTIRFVRIEYPGNKIKVDEEFNGLTLAGIGRNTTIENVQVSYSNDDSYELYGGTVDLKKIISYKCSDDDFDFNYGYQGKTSYGIAFRNPLIGDFSGSRCFEVDSYNADKKGFDPNKRFTNITASHFTLIQYDVNGNNQTVFSTEAVQIGNESALFLEHSVVCGFPNVFKIKNTKYKDDVLKNQAIMGNNAFNGYQTLVNGTNAEELKNILEKESAKNDFLDLKTTELFADINNRIYPNFKFNLSRPSIVSK